jgi:hypothetical protein
MRLASFLGLADITDEETATKHVTAIKLKSDYRWCLEDEFRSILEGKTTNTEVNLLDFPPS